MRPLRRHWPEVITAEHALFAAVAILAAVLRFSALAAAPLAPAEAEEALAVWQLSRPGAAALGPGSPAYFTLTAIAAQIGGYSDALMRLVPALFGLATVLLPYFLRRQLGRGGALLAGFLLALSPTVTYSARTAGGDAIALFAGPLLVVAWLRYQETGRRAWWLALAVALALGMASTPLFYTLALSVAAAWVLQTSLGAATDLAADGASRPLPQPDRGEILAAAGRFVTLFVIVATGFFLNLDGIGVAVGHLTEWVAMLAIPTDLEQWLGPILALGRYEWPLVTVGLPAAVWAAWQGRRFPTLLVFWMVATLLIMLAQPGHLPNLLAFVLPGYLLVGRFVHDLFAVETGLEKWPVAGLVLGGGLVIYANLIRFSRLATAGGDVPGADPSDYHRLLLLIVLAAVALLVGYFWTWNPAAGRQGLAIGVLALLALYGWGTSWWLTHRGAADTRERWVVVATDPDLPRLAANLREISWSLTGSGTDLEVISEIDSPALRWYLRDFRELHFEPILPGISDRAAMITAATRTPALDQAYTGTDFRLTRQSSDRPVDRLATLRWWLFHDAAVQTDVESAILWLPLTLIGEAE